jgi:hypothetical protein
MVGTTALTLNMSILWQDIFVGTKKLTLWNWRLTYFWKTLLFAISFEWHVLGLSYFTWMFLRTRSFRGYQQIWLCDIDLGVWPSYLNFNHAYIFWMIQDFDVSHEYLLWQVLSVGTNSFDLMNLSLTFVFALLTENFNLGCIFWMVCIRILIVHMSVCCDKIDLWVPTGLILWPSPLCLTDRQKITLAISF